MDAYLKPPANPTRKSRWAGRLWQLLGILLLIFGADHLVFIVLLNVGQWPLSTRWIQGLIAMAYWAAGVVCLTRARRHRSQKARLLAESDTRPPVLYLRSFLDDRVAGKTVGSAFTGFSEFALGAMTEEEQLGHVLNAVGPFKGIGRPGEKLPNLGAIRYYVAKDPWQEAVVSELSKAALVVLRVGQTAGVVEEARLVIQHVAPERLILLVPASGHYHSLRKTSAYEAFRRSTESDFPRPLPDSSASKKSECGSLSGVVYFAPDWTPHFVRLAAPRWWSAAHLLSCGRPLIPRLTVALAPVFSRLGLVPPPLPVNWLLTTLRFGWWAAQAVSLLFVLTIIVTH